jgi:phytoene dehydrogenase-like protein
LRKRIHELKDYYDAVVIGSGLGGLTAANILGRNGHRVLLAEQHFQLGGLATYFRRGRHIFDVALHGFPIGMKKTLRKYWSEEMAGHIVQVKSVRYDNPQFSLETPFTAEDFTKKLTDHFRAPPETVAAFYKELDGMNYYDKNDSVNADLFEKYFPGRNDIVRFLMEPITYANGSTLGEPAITYGIVFSNFMSKGVYTFAGGTDMMLDMMEKELGKNSVDIISGAKADKVIIRDGKVSGAVIAGREIKCGTVITNGNILSAVRELAGEEHFSADFLSKVSKVRLNTGSCQVYIGLKKGEGFDFIGDLLFTSTHPVFSPEKIISSDVTSRTYSVYYPGIRPGHEDYTVVASMNARYQDWAGLNKDEYKRAKQKLVEDTLDALDKYIPGIRGKTDHLEAATPLTFKRYTLHGDGSSFGTKFEGLGISMGLPEQIGGLFHTGSVGIIMSGWLGAANYGVIVANNADKYLFQAKRQSS